MMATPSFFAFIVESKRPQRNSKGAVEVQQGGRRGTARRLRKNSKEAVEESQRGRRGLVCLQPVLSKAAVGDKGHMQRNSILHLL